ncbi:YciI family protein [Phenylobacterium sp.]|uniref:YciI family protein n=1 Tax=Phenylobacterium sp. TaxID=1871053 RepID=UPI0012185BF1|nr:YciI family protein [Phenylobacterium sp.]THD58287.1 MAG: YciI family protein [Phenylobacterium sp.]
MALFMLACFDKPNSLDLRMATREAHLAYVRENAAMVKLAGPLLDEAEAMAGSLFVLDCADRAAAQAFNAADPYQTAGLFGTVEIRGFKATIGQLG